MDDFEQSQEQAQVAKVLENESRKYRSDRILIESLREVQAIRELTRALEEMIDARNRHTTAMEREFKAFRELEEAKRFAGLNAIRKPPAIVQPRDQRDRRAEEVRKMKR